MKPAPAATGRGVRRHPERSLHDVSPRSHDPFAERRSLSPLPKPRLELEHATLIIPNRQMIEMKLREPAVGRESAKATAMSEGATIQKWVMGKRTHIMERSFKVSPNATA